ncbi:MAG: LacI family transcriptional regulator [Bacteroidetes bacterium]|nr:MAG: LacI family transcriptional regulator [Bacteroidota bacterium]
MKKIYLKDIAKSLQVSKTTVSLVLNNKGDVHKISKDTQKRILDFARKNNYKPNHLARGLSRGKSETIGLIVPNISDVFYAKIAGCIEKKAKEFGYTVVFSSSNENTETEKELILSMMNRQVDGLIIASTQQNETDIQQLKNAKFPFVLIDRHYPDIDTNYVIVDNHDGVKNVTQYLINLGKEKIGFISIEPKLEAIKQRLYGYQDALLANDIQEKKEFIKELNNNNYQQQMKGVIKELVGAPNHVDAIVFSTHYLTASGLRELKAINCKVPDEVAIVSFDELAAFDLVDPAITSVIQPVNEIGNYAVEILVDEIENKGKVKEKKKILETSLIIRKSCGTS